MVTRKSHRLHLELTPEQQVTIDEVRRTMRIAEASEVLEQHRRSRDHQIRFGEITGLPEGHYCFRDCHMSRSKGMVILKCGRTSCRCESRAGTRSM